MPEPAKRPSRVVKGKPATAIPKAAAALPGWGAEEGGGEAAA